MDARCPRKIKELKGPCHHGHLGANRALENRPGGCPWFVRDAESGWCFFKFMEDNGDFPVPLHRMIAVLASSSEEIRDTVRDFRKRFAGELEPSVQRVMV